MKYLFVAALALSLIAAEAVAQFAVAQTFAVTPVRPITPGAPENSCTGQNNICLTFCARNPDRTECVPDCNIRIRECFSSGEYYWLNRPTAKNLLQQ